MIGTVGVLTKLDLMDAGTDAADILQVAKENTEEPASLFLSSSRTFFLFFISFHSLLFFRSFSFLSLPFSFLLLLPVLLLLFPLFISSSLPFSFPSLLSSPPFSFLLLVLFSLPAYLRSLRIELQRRIAIMFQLLLHNLYHNGANDNMSSILLASCFFSCSSCFPCFFLLLLNLLAASSIALLASSFLPPYFVSGVHLRL